MVKCLVLRKEAYQNGLNKILIVRLVHEVRSCYLNARLYVLISLTDTCRNVIPVLSYLALRMKDLIAKPMIPYSTS